MIFFSSLFHRANGQSGLYAITHGKGKVIVLLDPVWYLTVYSGKVESSGLYMRV